MRCTCIHRLYRDLYWPEKYNLGEKTVREAEKELDRWRIALDNNSWRNNFNDDTKKPQNFAYKVFDVDFVKDTKLMGAINVWFPYDRWGSLGIAGSLHRRKVFLDRWRSLWIADNLLGTLDRWIAENILDRWGSLVCFHLSFSVAGDRWWSFWIVGDRWNRTEFYSSDLQRFSLSRSLKIAGGISKICIWFPYDRSRSLQICSDPQRLPAILNDHMETRLYSRKWQ